MKRLFCRKTLESAALALILVQPLGAENVDQTAPREKSGSTVQVQPSADVRYPQAKDIINSQVPAKPAVSGASAAPSGAPLWGSSPVPVRSTEASKASASLSPGWYFQAPASGNADELQAQAVGLVRKLSPDGSKKVWLQTDGKNWTALVGPWTPQETADFLKTLNQGKAPAENLSLVRR